MGRHRRLTTKDAELGLQEAIDASDVIGRWRYDVPNDRLYADTMVALVLNVDPMVAQAGIPIETFLAGVHPDDRERTARQFKQDEAIGGRCVLEYRVCSSDGVTRRVLDRGHIEHDAAGRPSQGHGVLIDVTQTRFEEAPNAMKASASAQHPLERAADQCLALNRTISELPDPLLRRMSDMLLLELGIALAKIADRPSGKAAN